MYTHIHIHHKAQSDIVQLFTKPPRTLADCGAPPEVQIQWPHIPLHPHYIPNGRLIIAELPGYLHGMMGCSRCQHAIRFSGLK